MKVFIKITQILGGLAVLKASADGPTRDSRSNGQIMLIQRSENFRLTLFFHDLNMIVTGNDKFLQLMNQFFKARQSRTSLGGRRRRTVRYGDEFREINVKNKVSALVKCDNVVQILDRGDLTPTNAYYLARVAAVRGNFDLARQLLDGALDQSDPFSKRKKAEEFRGLLMKTSGDGTTEGSAE